MGVNWSQHVWFVLKTINEIHAGPSNDILVLRIGQDIPAHSMYYPACTEREALLKD